MALNTFIRAARKETDKLRTKQVLVHGMIIDMNMFVHTVNTIDYNIRKMKSKKQKYKQKK